MWTGSEAIVWGGQTGDGTFLSTGGRYDPATDTWTSMSNEGAPLARVNHTAVWGGRSMLVWGGLVSLPPSSVPVDTGAAYDPASDTWQPIGIAGAPSPRSLHSATWIGSSMIVWGGRSGPTAFADGGRYDPASDTWSVLALAGAPAPRFAHSAVWTGDVLVVWGGLGGGSLATGGRYDPDTNTWLPTSLNGAPAGRFSHTALWTGAAMLVWGGTGGATPLGSGALYDPVTNSWTATASTGPRSRHSAVWTGGRMLVWGGLATRGSPPESFSLGSGESYDPVANAWTSIAAVGAPTARSDHRAIWTGSSMLVWGGQAGPVSLASVEATGARYAPATDSWAPTDTGLLAPRTKPSVVWTGSELIVWGGEDVLGEPYGDGARYEPATDTWTPTSPIAAPQARSSHTAVWAGDRMLVWGGEVGHGVVFTNTGAAYEPITDAWTALSVSGAPRPRFHHTAVWTGARMLVWGGENESEPSLGDGGRYDPAANTWNAISTSGAPPPRTLHTAVWSGSEMIVWGGDGVGVGRSGGRYNPVSDTWMATTIVGAPLQQHSHSAVWSGNEMIVWGGCRSDAGPPFDAGGRYDPSTDAWRLNSTVDAPGQREGHQALWTGSLMLVWGGRECAETAAESPGGRFDPVRDTWVSLPSDGAPRDGETTAVWTGAEMLVWGGGCPFTCTGGRYAPGLDADCDGFDDARDCAVLDLNVFAAPAEVSSLVVARGGLAWESAAPGAGLATVHDVATGVVSELPVGTRVGESCIVSGTVGSGTSLPSGAPAPGTAKWYLVRARNVCGVGTYGFDSAGRERVTGVCRVDF